MRFNLEVSMANQEGALERILGRLRQRGFVVLSMNAGCSPNFSRMDARFTLESERPIDLAVKQIKKLFDVDDVVICDEEHTGDSITRVRQSEFDYLRTPAGHELAFPAYRHHGHVCHHESVIRRGH